MKNIYVGNLDFRTTEEELRNAFQVYGQIDKAEIMRDRESGQARGFAFVEMTNDEEGDKAIAGLNGAQMEGRTLKVNEARPKNQRVSSGGDRGRSGGAGRY
jgi:RNA recognition motif-containing protein